MLLTYIDIRQECPEGVVQEDCFKEIYAKFFPHGSEYYGWQSINMIQCNAYMYWHLATVPPTNHLRIDSSIYAHYVFKAFDVNCNGAISFRVSRHANMSFLAAAELIRPLFVPLQDFLVTLSTLLRGSVYERLRWTFKLYDLNGDGCISRGELSEVVQAVHELMGRRPHQPEDDRKARDQVRWTYSPLYWKLIINCRWTFKVDRVFRKLDLNQDGIITIEEFLEACLKDDLVTQSLQMFDVDICLWWPTAGVVLTNKDSVALIDL